MYQQQSPAQRTGLRALATRYPISFFLASTFGLTYPLMSLAIMAQYGVIPGSSLPSMIGLDMERAVSFLMLLLGLFPATLLVTALEGGRPAVRVLFERMFRWRIGLTWWLTIAVALPGLTVAVALLLGDSFRIPNARVIGGEVVGIVVAFLLINLCEETAWSGFLQTRLERRHNFVVATLLTIIPFAAIHVPLRIINGVTAPSEVALSFLLLLILGVIVRPLMAIVLRGTGDSIFAAGLLHTFFNRSNNIDGIAADLLSGPNRPIAALIATLLLTVVLGLSNRRRLTRANRRELDAMNNAAMNANGGPDINIGNTSAAFHTANNNV